MEFSATSITAASDLFLGPSGNLRIASELNRSIFYSPLAIVEAIRMVRWMLWSWIVMKAGLDPRRLGPVNLHGQARHVTDKVDDPGTDPRALDVPGYGAS